MTDRELRRLLKQAAKAVAEPSQDPLALMRSYRRLRDAAEDELTGLVTRARQQQAGWQQIADSLGLTRQGASQWYRRATKAGGQDA